MAGKVFAILPLIFLAAGAAPPDAQNSSCGQSALSPSGPGLSVGAGGSAFAPIPAPGDAPEGATQETLRCGAASPSPQIGMPRVETGDILHGLPAPDLLRRIDEPRRAPEFQ